VLCRSQTNFKEEDIFGCECEEKRERRGKLSLKIHMPGLKSKCSSFIFYSIFD
jgi:hypothetical protein